MAPRALYLYADTEGAGSSLATLGLMELLTRTQARVAFFKPVALQREDADVALLRKRFHLSVSDKEAVLFTLREAQHYIVQNGAARFFTAVIEHVDALKRRYDVVLCEGIYSDRFANIVELDINVELAKNLSMPVINLIHAHGRDVTQLHDIYLLHRDALRQAQVDRIATIFNRCDATTAEAVRRFDERVYAVADIPLLRTPTLADIVRMQGAVSLRMTPFDRVRPVDKVRIAAAKGANALADIDETTLLIASPDREDVADALRDACARGRLPGLAALMWSADVRVALPLRPEGTFPVLQSAYDALETARRIDAIEVRIDPEDARKIAAATGAFEAAVDVDAIRARLQTARPQVVTPSMFAYRLFARARNEKRRIVLPESDDPRILEAAHIVLARGIAEVAFVADKARFRIEARRKGYRPDEACVLDTKDETLRRRYAEAYYAKRRHKGIDIAQAYEAMEDVNLFATMAVVCGDADGLVSGATHTTADTIRPALQLLRSSEGFKSVSSIFFMCLQTRVLVFGDCAVIEEPNVEELAHIAVQAAANAERFGIEPIVAMISYATGESAEGDDVQKVRRAVARVRELAPDLAVDGPMQFDAAFDAEVGRRKLPGSPVAGRATVFVFPDLNTGNTTYKAVQRSSGAVAIGPVLQGLQKPVNDLSRGATVEDIVNTIAITAIQAQGI